MINLDANYGAADFADTADLPENHAHHQIQDELMQECEDIKRQLPISSFLRPAWIWKRCSRTGVEEFSFDLGISKRIYTEKDEFYNPTPMFLIFAKKTSRSMLNIKQIQYFAACAKTAPSARLQSCFLPRSQM